MVSLSSGSKILTQSEVKKNYMDLKFKKQKLKFEENMAAKVEIYTWKSCPYCLRAKDLLNKKGVEFIEYSVDGDEEARTKMAERANGRRSVPQIFINNQHIGGCEELYELNASGKLDELLQTSPN